MVLARLARQASRSTYAAGVFPQSPIAPSTERTVNAPSVSHCVSSHNRTHAKFETRDVNPTLVGFAHNASTTFSFTIRSASLLLRVASSTQAKTVWPATPRTPSVKGFASRHPASFPRGWTLGVTSAPQGHVAPLPPTMAPISTSQTSRPSSPQVEPKSELYSIAPSKTPTTTLIPSTASMAGRLARTPAESGQESRFPPSRPSMKSSFSPEKQEQPSPSSISSSVSTEPSSTGFLVPFLPTVRAERQPRSSSHP